MTDDDPVERFIERAREAGRKVKPQGSHYLVSCPGPSHVHGDRDPSLHVSRGRDHDCVLKCFAGCDPRDIVDALHMTMAELFVARARDVRMAEPDPIYWHVDDYDYRGELGELVFRVRRYEGIDLTSGRRLKTFRQQRRDRGAWVNNLAGVERTLYRLPELREGIATGRAVWIVEGEKDVETLRRLGKVATTAGAATAWRPELVEHLAGAKAITVVADRDVVGFELARRIAGDVEAAGLGVRVLVPAEPAKDVTELVDGGGDLEALVPLEADTEAPAPKDDVEAGRLQLQSLEGLQVRPVRWLWHHRIALGQIALLAGREGIGKSTTALALAAQITRGTLEGDYLGRARDVVIVATEDSFEHTIAPRLMAADADLARVYRVTMTEEYAALAFPRDLPELERACAGHDVGLIVLDPLMSRVGAELDSHRDQQVRQALEPIGALADRLRASVLGLIHVNKGGSVDPLERVMASKAFTAVARSVLYAMKDPVEHEPAEYLLGLVKSNLGPIGLPTLTYTFEATTVAETDEGPVITSRVVWGEPTARQIDEILAADPGAETKIEAAARWLRDYLCEHGRMPAVEVLKAGAGEDPPHAKRTLQDATKRAGVVFEKVGFPAVPFWRLAKVDPEQRCKGDELARADAPAHAREGSKPAPQCASGDSRGTEVTEVQTPSLGRDVASLAGELDTSMFDD